MPDATSEMQQVAQEMKDYLNRRELKLWPEIGNETNAEPVISSPQTNR